MPLFERLSAAPGTGTRERGTILRYYARNGRFADAYHWIETRLMTQLVLSEPSDAMQLLSAVGIVTEGDPEGRTQQRWRSDPHAAATWPELALPLYWYQVRTFGEDHALPFSDPIGAIPVTDFRARPLVTLALAHTYDERVMAWAIAELARPPARPVDADETDGRERRNDPAILPLRVLASAWATDYEPLLTRIFCEGGARRRLVIFALGQWGDQLYGELLGKMAAFPGLDEDDRAELRRAALQMAARDIDGSGDLASLGDDDDATLVTRLLSRRPPTSTPLTCPA
jgi:hypothetical protein